MQGYSVVRVPPFWEVVEIKNDRGRTEHIVVDTMPRLHDRRPVKVFGPASKATCLEWAKSTALLYLTLKGSLVEGSS